MSKEEILHKEIDLIQSCITRMANNSFIIKGWLISLVVVVLALVGEKVSLDLLCFILIVPIFSFWYLDAFFLQTEKKYRLMYEWVIEKRLESDKHLYDLNPKRFDKKIDSILKVMFSKTLWVFYFIPGLVVIALLVIEKIPK